MRSLFYKSCLSVGVLFVAIACGKNNDNNQTAATPTACAMPGQTVAQGCLIGGTCQMNQGWYVQGATCVQSANGQINPNLYPNGQFPGQNPGGYYPPQQPQYGYWGNNNLGYALPQVPYGGAGIGASFTIGAGAGTGFGGYAGPSQSRYIEQQYYSGCGAGCSTP